MVFLSLLRTEEHGQGSGSVPVALLSAALLQPPRVGPTYAVRHPDLPAYTTAVVDKVREVVFEVAECLLRERLSYQVP